MSGRARTANSQNNHIQLVITPTEVTFIVGMLTESRYEIDGNTIAFGSAPQPGQPLQLLTPVPFSIDGAALTITRTPGHPIVLKRVDEFRPDAHPIIGAWTYQHPVGLPAVLRFTPGGALQTMMIRSSVDGPYGLENDVLMMQVRGRADCRQDQAGRQSPDRHWQRRQARPIRQIRIADTNRHGPNPFGTRFRIHQVETVAA